VTHCEIERKSALGGPALPTLQVSPGVVPSFVLAEHPSRVGRRPIPQRRCSFLRVAAGRPGRNLPPALLRASAISPVGRVALMLDPPRCTPQLLVHFFFSHLTRSVRVFVGPTARTGGRPREACGEGGTTVGANLLPEGPRPTLLPGHRPFLPAERSSSAATLPCTGGAPGVPA
jgi:hypothetical protein